MEFNKNNIPLHTDNKKEHNNVSFERNKKDKEQEKLKEERIRYEKERLKLEKMISRRIEKADKKEKREKRKNKAKHILIKNSKEDTSIIPTIPIKQFIDRKEAVETEKKSFISELLETLKKNATIRKEKREEEKRRKLIKKEQRKQEKLNRIEETKNKKNAAVKLLKDNDILSKEELKIKKEEEKQRRILEKEKKKQENLENVKTNSNVTLKEERKKKREEAKRRKEQRKQEKQKKKYELFAKKQKEKEEKQLKTISDKNEKRKQLNKEKEQARKDRKEKALLIKKAQEESKQKEKKERKSLEERLKNWYNNLSFVKDKQNRREMQRQTLLIDFEGADAVRSEEKVMYKYVAKNNETGKVETGYFAAFSKLDVHSFLLAEGYEVYEITPQSNFKKPFSFGPSKFSPNDLDFFLTQLSTFLKAGITLVDSVKILSKQSNKKSHKNIYKMIIYELTMGENFSEALAKQGTIFPRLLINMIKTAELTGDLPETLDDMADYYRETEKTRKQMVSAVTYPVVVLLFAIAVLIFIMVGVIPQFVGIYSNLGTELPGITVAVINLSNFLKNNWMYLLIGVVAFVLIFVILFKTIKVFKTVIQSMLMNLPVIGKIIIYNEITMFTKTFASLLNHNVYITDCMEVLSKITNNEVYKMLIFDTITNLAKGEAISNSFKNHWAFPNVAYEMILTGEKTGQLGTMMDRVANYYQEQHKNAVNQIKAFIEPIMIVILAGIVGTVLLSVVLPMFDMYQGIT
jgi:type IV pilus assembly protein PilC